MTAREERHPRERLSALVDEELTPEERAGVEDHLRDCPSCRELLDGLRSVARAAAIEEPPALPAGLEDRVSWQLRSARWETSPRSAKPWWRSTVPLSVAATLAGFGILIGVWRLERGEPGIPGPLVPPPMQSADTTNRPLAPPSRSPETAPVEAAPRDETKAPTPPRRAAAKARPSASARPAKVVPEEKGEQYAPSPVARGEKDEPMIVGGVVGGVLGGLAGGEGTASDAASESRAKSAARPQAPASAGPPAPAAPAGGAFKRGASEQRSGCSSVVVLSPEPSWRLRSADPEAAGAGLARLAESLGGHAIRLEGAAGAWRVEVPRGRWPEFATALRELGVDGADPLDVVPGTTECVEVRVSIVS